MATRIGIGLIGLPFSGAAAFWRWVDLCERSGIDSLWQADRLVGEAASLECLSAMAALAGATRKIKFGMSVLAMGWREPLVVAKALATIDFLSEGRLLPAFGVGALKAPEWRALGLDPQAGQGRRVDEGLETLLALWRGDGEVKISPRPVQANLPLWIGGSSPAAIRRTVRYGTGWLGGVETPERAGEAVAQIKAGLAAAGRAIDEDHYGGGFFYRFGNKGDVVDLAGLPPGAGHSMVVGGAVDIVARIREYEAVGVTKLVLRPLAVDDEEMISQTRRLAEEVIPLV